MYIDFNDIVIELDASVRHITSAACMHLSSILENGIVLADNPTPYIKIGKNGYKEIHYDKNGDKYIIKHYYKPNKDSHTIKSYFSLNGEELNENGNVTSFLSLVEIHFGLTQEMMRLVRLGTNVNSFITLQPAKRKEYIGKLIEEIDMYLKIHKKINEERHLAEASVRCNRKGLGSDYFKYITIEPLYTEAW